MPHVFISYVRDDEVLVDRLASELRSRGVDVWLDRERIKPGDRWRDAIRSAIRTGAYFIACFSTHYAARDQTYMNEELTLAIEEMRLRPTTRTWFIPARLPGGSVPDRRIGGGETLHDLQWVDFGANWRNAFERLMEVIGEELPPKAGGTPTLKEGRMATPLRNALPPAVQHVLATGVAIVPDHLTESVQLALVQSAQTRIDAVSHDDLPFWTSTSPRSWRYRQENMSAVKRGCRVTRLFLLPARRLKHDYDRLCEVLAEQMLGGIDVALVVREAIEAKLPIEHYDFVMFDGGQITTVYEKVYAVEPPSLVLFGEPAGIGRIQQKRAAYITLLDNCVLATEHFIASSVRLAQRANNTDAILCVRDVGELEEKFDVLLERLASSPPS